MEPMAKKNLFPTYKNLRNRDDSISVILGVSIGKKVLDCGVETDININPLNLLSVVACEELNQDTSPYITTTKGKAVTTDAILTHEVENTIRKLPL